LTAAEQRLNTSQPSLREHLNKSSFRRQQI
jgi:hypothetical protein